MKMISSFSRLITKKNLFESFFITLIILIFTAEPADAQAVLGDSQKGRASFYSSRFNGRKTAFGEIHRSTELTAAHRSLPLNTMLEVTNLSNNKKIVVRVNDRGPFAKNRIIDVSKEAAKVLGIVSAGIANVIVRVVGMEGMIMLGEDEMLDPITGKIIYMLQKEKKQ